MNRIIDLSWTQLKRTRVIGYWILVLVILLSIWAVSNKRAYADGSVPPNAAAAYPGIDPRLIGVPIIKTDMTEALVQYSQAVDKVRNLESERASLNAVVALLGPQVPKAQANLDLRTDEFEQVEEALSTLIISQYQSISDKEIVDNSTAGATEMRLSHQSVKVLKSLREWKAKAKKKMNAAQKHLDSVESTLDNSDKRLETLATDIASAKNAAKDSRDVVRSGIPVALIESLEIPVLTMDAYLRAEIRLAAERPQCGITWWSLAGIGRAESNHGRYGGRILDQTGTVSPPIIGVQLNGNGFAAIGDSDDGLLDGDTEWDRAVGVMQFIPGTWKGYAEDGNGDGVTDPQNVYDAALAAGNLLCANARPDMKSPEGRRTAFMRYNNSSEYVDFVETRGKEYEAIGAGRFNPAPPSESTDPAQ
jgi:membrane-bound lytic murein transglycosylase B